MDRKNGDRKSAAFTIGRDDTNDIVVEDSSVSRCHAELRLDGDEIVLVDLDSLNGTHVREDGRWIEIARASVKRNEPVLLGEVVITPDSLLNRAAQRGTAPGASAEHARRVAKPAFRDGRRAPPVLTAPGRPLDQRVAATGTGYTGPEAGLEARPAPTAASDQFLSAADPATDGAPARRRRDPRRKG